jgi:DNA repair exonuclease SbcCD ATPase subunit
MSVESKIQELLEQAENLENSSEDLSLTEEDLELFSEEELNELIENMDQLDEISKATLGSYINKAAGSMALNHANEGKARRERSELQSKAGDLGMSFNDTEKALEKRNLEKDSK